MTLRLNAFQRVQERRKTARGQRWKVINKLRKPLIANLLVSETQDACYRISLFGTDDALGGFDVLVDLGVKLRLEAGVVLDVVPAHNLVQLAGNPLGVVQLLLHRVVIRRRGSLGSGQFRFQLGELVGRFLGALLGVALVAVKLLAQLLLGFPSGGIGRCLRGVDLGEFGSQFGVGVGVGRFRVASRLCRLSGGLLGGLLRCRHRAALVGRRRVRLGIVHRRRLRRCGFGVNSVAENVGERLSHVSVAGRFGHSYPFVTWSLFPVTAFSHVSSGSISSRLNSAIDRRFAKARLYPSILLCQCARVAKSTMPRE